jgi:potassium/hydrogen antiporter
MAVWLYILIAGAVLLLVSVFASKLSERLGVPALLMFLVIGMLAGSEGIGGIYFDDANAARILGTIALIFILFAGGLDTNWQTIRPVLWSGVSLSTIGVLLCAVLIGIYAVLLLKFSVLDGLLLGAIVSSTDAAAVFSILRAKKVSLRGKIKPLLELESGSNDPMAVFLTVGMIKLIDNPQLSWMVLAPMFLQQYLIGSAVGFAFGRGIVYLVNRLKLEYEGLYPVLTVSLVVLTFGAAELLRGNGFLAVYIAGLLVGNSNFLHKRSLKQFHDGLAWLMQIAMFLTLGLLIFPSHLIAVWPAGLMLAMFLMFLARPISTFISLAFSGLTMPEKTFASWVGLRGAAPIVLATFPLLAGCAQAGPIFNLVFFIVITSVLLQGKSLPLVAGWLGLAKPFREKLQYPLEFEGSEKAGAGMVEVEIPSDSIAVGKRILDCNVPKGALVVLIYRNAKFFVPSGSTVLAAGDRMLILANEEPLRQIRGFIERRPAAETSNA